MREIDRCIRECEHFIDRSESTGNVSGAVQIVNEVYGAMASVPNIKSGLRKFAARAHGSKPYSASDAALDIRVLAGKLRAHRDNLDHEIEIERLRAAQRGATIVLSDVGNSSSTSSASASASAEVTLPQVMERVESDHGLSDEQKSELEALLAQAKDAATKKDKGLFARASEAIMGKVADAAPKLILELLKFLATQAMGL